MKLSISLLVLLALPAFGETRSDTVPPAAQAALESSYVKLSDGATLKLEAGPAGTRLMRDSETLRELGGSSPVTILSNDLNGNGKPEHLAVVQEGGSGGYGQLLLVSDDGRQVLWESRPWPGVEAKPQGKEFRITRVLKGDRPEGDVLRLASLSWGAAGPVYEEQAVSQPKNGWQALTAGREAMRRADWKEAVTLFTRAVDSEEAKTEELGAPARHHLARALIADKQAGRARSILVGLKKLFPQSTFTPEANRTIDLFDASFKFKYDPLVLLVRAEEYARAEKWDEVERRASDILTKYASAGLSDRAHYLLGQAYEAQDRKKQAVKEFQTIVLYFPSSPLSPIANEEIKRLELGK